MLKLLYCAAQTTLCWASLALLVTFLQRQIPSDAAIVRYTIAFGLLMVSVPLAAQYLPVASEVVAKTMQPRRSEACGGT